MSDVDAELIARWAAGVLDERRPRGGLGLLDERGRAVLGSGLAAIHAAVAAEDLTALEQSGPPAGTDDPVLVAVHGYLLGVAQGIAATGADREPTSLVAGLVTAAARLRFAWPDASPLGAVDRAERIGLTAADLVGEGADLLELMRGIDDTMTATLHAWLQDTGDADALDGPDFRLITIITDVLSVLGDLVVAAADDTAPGLLGGCRPRRFLAEVSFTVDGSSSVHLRVSRALEDHGTSVTHTHADAENVRRYHVHTVQAGTLVSEVYGITTPFDLTIQTTEPPLRRTMP